MEFAEPWVSLPAPTASPESSTSKLLLALVLSRFGREPGIPLPRRDIQQARNRASGAGVSKSLKRLVTDGWLAVAEYSIHAEPHTYALGPKLKSRKRVRADWFEIAERIHGASGLFEVLEHPPVFARGAFTENDALVLGALVSAARPPTLPELRQFLAPLISPRSIADAMKRLAAGRVLEPGALVPPGDWQQRLDDLLTTSGAWQRQTRVDYQVAQERVARNVWSAKDQTRRDVFTRRGSRWGLPRVWLTSNL